MRFILIPDSFKGTMSSQDICDIMADAITSQFADAETIKIPVADGGEGTVDSFVAALKGEKVKASAQNPYQENIDSFYGVCDNTVIVEMAAAAGLPLVSERLCAEKTTTYGVGQLIAQAVGRPDVERLIIGLGGSATNDGGCGAAAALGVRFYNSDGNEFVPVGATLKYIDRIDKSGLLPRLSEIEITAMCDIDNPLCGEQGASAVFGPQKGADPEMVERLDAGLLHLSKVMKRDLGVDVSDTPGAGAAGGMGAGVVAFLNGALQMGIEVVLDVVGFDRLVHGADMVLTGEGRIDGQSLRGKVVIGVARKAKLFGVPTIAIVGDISEGAQNAFHEGVDGIFTINRLAVPYSAAKLTARDDLYFTVRNIMRFYSATKSK